MGNASRRTNGKTTPKKNNSGNRNQTGSRVTTTVTRATTTTARIAAARTPNRNGSRKNSRRRKKMLYRRITVGVISAAILVLLLFLAIKLPRQVRLASKMDTILIYVDGENFSDMPREQAKKFLEEKYAWDMTVSYQDQSMSIENPFIDAINTVVNKAYNEAEREQERLDRKTFWNKFFGREETEQVVIQYDLDLPTLDEIAEELAKEVADKWSIPAKNSEIIGYDAAGDVFEFSQAENGMVINQEKLKEDILRAYQNGEYQAVLTAEADSVAPEIQKNAYRVMGSYTTTTTNNQDRNTNVRLASEAVNGQIVQPGEQFSYNTVVGQRTAEKGYKPAAAYANGETVQEYGGGVCQVSSTLYNAVIAAGLQTNERTGHSYEPTYVTPGQDATVSYSKPDFVFTNTSEVPIGIRTSFQNRTMYVEIFGVPVLEQGTKRYMESKEVSLVDPPAPTYVEDPAVPFGEEVLVKNATNGSIWTTDIVLEKDGEVIERSYLHQTRYKGHAAVIHRNTQTPTAPAPADDDD